LASVGSALALNTQALIAFRFLHALGVNALGLIAASQQNSSAVGSLSPRNPAYARQHHGGLYWVQDVYIPGWI
jgi:hypothetical protein